MNYFDAAEIIHAGVDGLTRTTQIINFIGLDICGRTGYASPLTSCWVMDKWREEWAEVDPEDFLSGACSEHRGAEGPEALRGLLKIDVLKYISGAF